jgi:hypothetical protein
MGGLGGWRWWSPGGLLYISLATEINWLRVEVGPVELLVRRRHKTGGDGDARARPR